MSWRALAQDGVTAIRIGPEEERIICVMPLSARKIDCLVGVGGQLMQLMDATLRCTLAAANRRYLPKYMAMLVVVRMLVRAFPRYPISLYRSFLSEPFGSFPIRPDGSSVGHAAQPPRICAELGKPAPSRRAYRALQHLS